jgi:hypothetical protein
MSHQPSESIPTRCELRRRQTSYLSQLNPASYKPAQTVGIRVNWHECATTQTKCWLHLLLRNRELPPLGKSSRSLKRADQRTTFSVRERLMYYAFRRKEKGRVIAVNHHFYCGFCFGPASILNYSQWTSG